MHNIIHYIIMTFFLPIAQNIDTQMDTHIYHYLISECAFKYSLKNKFQYLKITASLKWNLSLSKTIKQTYVMNNLICSV